MSGAYIFYPEGHPKQGDFNEENYNLAKAANRKTAYGMQSLGRRITLGEIYYAAHASGLNPKAIDDINRQFAKFLTDLEPVTGEHANFDKNGNLSFAPAVQATSTTTVTSQAATTTATSQSGRRDTSSDGEVSEDIKPVVLNSDAIKAAIRKKREEVLADKKFARATAGVFGAAKSSLGGAASAELSNRAAQLASIMNPTLLNRPSTTVPKPVMTSTKSSSGNKQDKSEATDSPAEGMQDPTIVAEINEQMEWMEQNSDKAAQNTNAETEQVQKSKLGNKTLRQAALMGARMKLADSTKSFMKNVSDTLSMPSFRRHSKATEQMPSDQIPSHQKDFGYSELFQKVGIEFDEGPNNFMALIDEVIRTRKASAEKSGAKVIDHMPSVGAQIAKNLAGVMDQVQHKLITEAQIVSTLRRSLDLPQVAPTVSTTVPSAPNNRGRDSGSGGSNVTL